MRLLFISTLYGYSWGGSEELWYKTALEAAKKGLDVHITMMGDRTAQHTKIEFLESCGVEIHFVGELKYVKPSILQRIVRKITRTQKPGEMINRFNWVETLQPDKILVNGATAVSLSHFPDLKDFLKNTRLDYDTLIQHHTEYGVLPSYQQKDLKAVLLKAKNNYTVSLRNTEVLERQLVFKIPNEVLVHNPSNIEEPSILPYPMCTTANIAVVARLDCNFKGQDILIQALASEELGDKDFIVNLYGKGPDEGYINSLISFYGLQNRVFIKGHVDNITSIWEQNHLLMLPSISEGTPISLVEAMSCGRAAIVTDVGDNSRLIRDEKNGFLTYGFSKDALIHVLKRAFEQKNEWAKMGENAYQVIQEQYEVNPAVSLLGKLI